LGDTGHPLLLAIWKAHQPNLVLGPIPPHLASDPPKLAQIGDSVAVAGCAPTATANRLHVFAPTRID
jgi:hypothetical protein